MFIAVLVANALVITAVAAIGVVSYERAAQVERADSIAAEYQASLDVFGEEVYQELNHYRRTRDAEGMRQAIDGLRDRAPKLESVSAYAEQNSLAYRDAEIRQVDLEQALTEVTEVSEEAIAAEPFFDAAEEVLQANPLEVIGETALPDGSRLRNEVIPGFEAVIAEFDAVDVPANAEEVAATVRAAPESMIVKVEALAAALDAGRGGAVGPGVEYDEAVEALNAYDSDLDERLDAALNRILGAGPEEDQAE